MNVSKLINYSTGMCSNGQGTTAVHFKVQLNGKAISCMIPETLDRCKITML